MCIRDRLLIIAYVVYHDNRESTFNTAYVATAGEMSMLSQRLAKASSLALQGDPLAFAPLRESHSKFSTNLESLIKGGVLFDLTVPPSPDNTQTQLQSLANIWAKTDKNAAQLSAMEKNLVVVGTKAVSYTHLDVYKRQPQRGRKPTRYGGCARVRRTTWSSRLTPKNCCQRSLRFSLDLAYGQERQSQRISSSLGQAACRRQRPECGGFARHSSGGRLLVTQLV